MCLIDMYQIGVTIFGPAPKSRFTLVSKIIPSARFQVARLQFENGAGNPRVGIKASIQ
jgi:hypothetical protein